MRPMTIPLTCGIAMAAMLAAGASHWWSVNHFVSMLEHGMPVVPQHSPSMPAAAQAPAMAAAKAAQPASASLASNSPVPSDPTHQEEFYEALIEKMAQVENQNRDLLDQLAETNRDLMKLEFRVDTHSESFRPLPIDQARPMSTTTNGLGVLPPRSDPSGLPAYE